MKEVLNSHYQDQVEEMIRKTQKYKVSGFIVVCMENNTIIIK